MKRFRPFFGRCLPALLCGVFAVVLKGADTNDPGPLTRGLTLAELRSLVLTRNETIQTRMLEFEVNRLKYKGEKGIFEPEFVGGYDHVDNKRQNTTEQLATSGYASTFEERNNLYNAGIESLTPIGTKVRLGYTLRDMQNNIQNRPPPFGTGLTNGEFVTFVGASLTQPLLKNAWVPATMASIRLAAVSSEIAFQDYRRQLMMTLSEAEASYWNLYLAQEQLMFFKQSVALAESILSDNRARLQAGRGSELEVLEGQAGLSLRQSKHAEARQKFVEAENRLSALYSESVITTNKLAVAVDEPEVSALPLNYFERWQAAFDQNPDYLMRRKRMIAENIRLAYAKNQRLPQLDLKASYGLNGLGDSPGSSWDYVEKRGFPAFTVGMEMRIPLGGGIKGRNELNASKLRVQQSLLGLKELEVQIANALDTAIWKARGTQEDVQNFQTVVAFNQELLQTRLKQHEAGKVESRKVFEVEADLYEAQTALAEARVKHQRAFLELQLVDGSFLKARHVELNQKELESRTSQLLKHGQLSEDQYQNFVKEMQLAYLQKQPPMTPSMEQQARDVLRTQYPAAGEPAKPMSQEDYEQALKKLDEQLKKLETRPAPKN